MKTPVYFVGKGSHVGKGRGAVFDHSITKTMHRKPDTSIHDIAAVNVIHDCKIKRPRYLNLKL